MSNKRERKTWLLVLAMVFLAAFLAVPHTVMAQDDTTEGGLTGDDQDALADGVGSWANAAQEQKAINLDAALDNLVAGLTDQLAGLDQSITERNEELAAAEEAGDEEAIDRITAELDALNDERDVLNDRLNEAAAKAAATDVSTIEQQRLDGMGWGEIAHELGVHPSTLGLGRGYAYGQAVRVAEMNTQRSMKGGLARGHGLLSDGSPAQNNGLGKAKSQAGGNAYGHEKNKSKGNQGKGKAKGKDKDKTKDK